MRNVILVSIITCLISVICYSRCKDEPTRIAVVDTGFGYHGLGKGVRLCDTGHADFTNEKVFTDPKVTGIAVPLDLDGHGTNITGIIEDYAKKGHANYCIMVIKYWTRTSPEWYSVQATVDSFLYAFANKASFINYSSGGSEYVEDEFRIIKKFTEGGGTMVVAAGNDSINLDLPVNHYYPAKYNVKIVVVGSLDNSGNRAYFSNYGKVVNRWELGYNVEGYSIIKSGTSMSTAIATGKIVSTTKNKCDIGD